MKNNEILYKDAKKLNSFRELIEDSVKKFSSKNAFIIKEKVEKNPKYKYITYLDFKNDVDNFAQGLISLGLQYKRIAVIGKNSYPWAIAYTSILSSVGIVVPLDKGLKPDEIESLIIRSKADCIVFDDNYIEIMDNIKQKNTTKLTNYICMKENNNGYMSMDEVIQKGKEEISAGKKDAFEYKVNTKEMSIILFTSGTTSISKAVMLSQDNILSNIYSLDCMVKFLDSDVSLAFLPFHHTFGSTALMLFLHNGVCTTFCDGLKYVQKNLEEYKVSVFVCVPLILEAMYKKIMVEVKKQNKENLIKTGRKICNFLLKFNIDIRRKVFKQILDQLGGHIRFVISGAAALDKDVAEGFKSFGITTLQGYGLTETSPVLSAENIKNLKAGSVGKPLYTIDIEIDSPDEKGIGEIKAKGPNVMLGYYENEEATNEVLKDGWFYTGDLGYFDEDNFLIISGRKKNVIVLKNGKKIFPEELEILVNNLPYVSESMIFGYPKDDDLIVSVEIVYNKDYVTEHMNNISYDELHDKVWNDIKEINKTLPTYKYIKKLFLTDEEMIKTTTAKVKRFKEIEKILNNEKKA